MTALAACGGSKAKHDAGEPEDGGSDAAVDAGACVLPSPLPACTTPVSGTNITLRELPRLPSSGAALLVTSPPNDPRLFVVDRSGLIYLYDNEQPLATPFLDINSALVAGGEQGLLGLAFHPQYACNGEFFVFYTTSNADVVARCTVSSDPSVANPTCTPVISVTDFASNHNGGMMEFGADGLLYIGTGDGGGGGDPQRTAQNPNNLLGKILRIDIDRQDPGKAYAIPTDNPFAAGGGAPEVFMLGLRNPWRWSFDKATGDLWIGDVGQRQIEELNATPAAQLKGRNFGWSMYEGSSCCETQGDRCAQTGTQYTCDPTGMAFPQDERTHANGWLSIIAGEVYRGTCFPDLVGWHFYTDYASTAAGLHRARLRTDGQLDLAAVPVVLPPNGTRLPPNVSSIHADARGELFMTTTGGRIFHLQATP